jgi:type IV secretion system protein TrbL
MNIQRALLKGFTVLPLLLFAGAAFAQTLSDPTQRMDGLMDMVVSASNQWAPRLQGYATTLLWSLAGIQIVIAFMPLVLGRAELGDIIHEVVKFILVAGFFAAMIQYTPDWSYAVVRSFRQAGAAAAGLSTDELTPGGMFKTAVEFSTTIANSASAWKIITETGTAFLITISALLVLLCFAFIAAFMFVTLVESYFIINASVLFFGFGGSSWTREFAIAPLRYTVAIGAKLFALTLIVGLILDVSAQWKAAYTADNASLLTLVGLAFVCAYLTKSIPDLVAGMITGTSMGGGGALGGMVAAGFGTGAALGTAAVGAAATVATAGAAAPAAIGATGAVGAGTAGAAGGGGLAGALGSSMAGGVAAGAGSTAGAGAGAVGAATGGAGAATGGSTAGMAAGGAAAKAPAAASGGQPASTTASGLKQVGQSAGGAGQQQSGQSTAAAASPSSSNLASTAKAVHAAADVGMKVAGAMAAISVPGMEGSQNVSLGAAPNLGQGSESGGDRGGNGDQATESESGGNVIRPASPAENVASTAPAETPAPSPTPDTGRVVSLASLKVPGMTTPPPAPQGGAA